MSDIKEMITEVRDRSRRVETRLAKFLEAQGFEINNRHPAWRSPGIIEVPDRNMSISEILKVIPSDWGGKVAVVHDNKLLCIVQLAPIAPS